MRDRLRRFTGRRVPGTAVRCLTVCVDLASVVPFQRVMAVRLRLLLALTSVTAWKKGSSSALLVGQGVAAEGFKRRKAPVLRLLE